MNNDEVLNMPAGYEINKLIAINVMGWALVNNHGAAGGKFWIGHGGSFGDMPERYLPDFSGEIAPAFSVVEKISNEWDFAIVNNQNFSKYPNEHYGFRLQALDKDSHIKTIFALGETAPLAICRAALLARGLTQREPDKN